MTTPRRGTAPSRRGAQDRLRRWDLDPARRAAPNAITEHAAEDRPITASLTRPPSARTSRPATIKTRVVISNKVPDVKIHCCSSGLR